MSTLTELEKRLRSVIADHPHARFAFVFGSTVTRGLEAARDVDVAVSFTREPSLLELGRLEGALERAIDRVVDVVDLDQATTLLRWEVACSGRLFWSGDDDAVLEFRTRVPLEYFDLKPHLQRQAEGLRRSLGVS